MSVGYKNKQATTTGNFICEKIGMKVVVIAKKKKKYVICIFGLCMFFLQC